MTDSGTITLANIDITPEQFEQILLKVKADLSVWMEAPWICRRLAEKRLRDMDTAAFPVFDGDAARFNVDPEEYRRNFPSYLVSGRMEPLLSLLGGVDVIIIHSKDMRLLTVGPTGEAEILAYMSRGFPLNGVTGLDLTSYHPLVRVGDMHDMPFPDNSFDVVVLGWALSLSADPKRVAEEALRVGGPGRYFAIGADYAPDGRTRDGRTAFRSVDEVLDLFDGRVQTVFFRGDVDPQFRSQEGDILTVFKAT